MYQRVLDECEQKQDEAKKKKIEAEEQKKAKPTTNFVPSPMKP